MTTYNNPDKKVVVRGQELALDMAYQGVQTLLSGVSITFNGQTYNQADLLKVIDDARAPLKDVRETRTALKKGIVVLREQRPSISELIRGLRTGLRGHYGDTNPEIEKFGFKALAPRRKLTSEEAYERAQKAKATREARHTMGSRQKEAVKGETPAPAPTPKPTS